MCEGEHAGIHVGASVGDVLGDKPIDFQQLYAALQADLSTAGREPADEGDFIVCGIDHRRRGSTP